MDQGFDAQLGFRVGKRLFLAGGEWHSAGDSQSATRKIAISDAKERSIDFFCIPKPGIFGLFDVPSGTRLRGAYSAAAAIMGIGGDVSASSLIAVRVQTEAGSGEAVSAIYVLGLDAQGFVHTGTDILVSEDVARDVWEQFRRDNTFMTVSAPGDWAELYSPSDWEAIRSINVGADELFAAKFRSARIRPIRGAGTAGLVTRVVIGSALAYGAYYGWNVWSEHQAKQRAATLAKSMEARNAMLRREAIQKAEQETWPYDGKLKGAVSLARCQSAMEMTPVVLPNHKLTSIQCDPGSGLVHANFKRDSQFAVRAYVRQYLDAMTDMHPRITDTDEGERITYDYSAAFKPMRSGDAYPKHTASGDLGNELNYLEDYFDSIHFPKALMLNQVNPAHRGLPKPGQPAPIDVMVFKKGVGVIQSSYSPTDFLEAFSPIRTWEVNIVEYAPAKGLWRIGFTIYQGEMQSVFDKERDAPKRKPLPVTPSAKKAENERPR